MDINDSNFDETIADGVSIVDFWAPWCAPCNILTPIIEEVAKEFEGKANMYKMNTDENPATSGKFGIMSIPTVMIFNNGNLVKTLNGLQPKENFVNALNEVIGS